MTSFQHEAIVELFRNRPVLAAELLVEVFSAKLPRFTEARVESADLGDVMPRELRADLLVLLLDGAPVLVVIVEAQLSDDPDKSFAWPAYVVGARARYRCPACLLVVTPDAALAKRLAKPIEVGPGEARITPFVLGPQGIPAITDHEEAKERPELAVLSSMAHGNTEIRIEVAMAALVASVGIEDEERRTLYRNLVLSSLSAAWRKILEKLVTIQNDELKGYFERRVIQFVREKGQLELLTHYVERRLARSLIEQERERLEEQLWKDGADRVLDLLMSLSPDALADWIAATNGS